MMKRSSASGSGRGPTAAAGSGSAGRRLIKVLSPLGWITSQRAGEEGARLGGRRAGEEGAAGAGSSRRP